VKRRRDGRRLAQTPYNFPPPFCHQSACERCGVLHNKTQVKKHSLGFIGAGKLAGSVIHGLLLRNFCTPGAIVASEPNTETRTQLQNELGISFANANTEVVEKAEVVFLGVKPQMVLPVLRELSGALANKLVVSFAAGIRIAQMEAVTPARIMRVLTNTPSAIGRAASAFAGGSRATDQDRGKIGAMFSAI
jgi:pyrroline-5-carboxylate reductase